MRKFCLILTSLLLVLCLCMTACGGLTIRENGDGSYTVTPNPHEGDDTQNNQPGNDQGSTDKPTAPDYSMYSPLLQEVLINPAYDELYRKYEKGEISEGSTGDLGLNIFEAIPFNFLEENGEDVEGIKNGSVATSADLYSVNNDTSHIYSKLDITYILEDGEYYINQYLLKYRITEQELKDLKMLYSGRFYQGPIMFQCLAAKQQPEVISEFSITENGYKKIINVCNSTGQYATLAKLLNHDKISNFTLTSLNYGTIRDEDSYDITFNLINEGNSNGTVSQKILYKGSTSLVWSTSKMTYSNGILNLESFSGINSKILSSTPITYFQLNHAFRDFKG